MLVEVLHSGEGHAGDQKNQPQLSPGVPQQMHRDGVGTPDHHHPHREQQKEEELQTSCDGLVRRLAVAQGQMLGGKVGHRRGQPHGGKRHDH